MGNPDPGQAARNSGRQRVRQEVAAKEQRKLSARRNKDRSVWFGLGMIGLVGWAVALPTVLGTATGVWLDHRFGGRYSWTLTGLLIGVAWGCLNAWYWVKRESRRN